MGNDSNEGYINIVVAVMQKFFDLTISGNWSTTQHTLKIMKFQ